MRAKHLLFTSILLATTYNCKSADKKFSSTNPSVSDDASTKFQSYDLGCNFDQISAKLVDDSTVTSTDAGSINKSVTCDSASQQYAMLLTEYDDNKDGKLTDQELAKSEYEYKRAQVQEIDKDSDNVISDDEILAWRTKNLINRSEKMNKKYVAACIDLKKDEASCKAMYEERRAECRAESQKEWELELERKKEYSKVKEDDKLNHDNYPNPNPDYSNGDGYGAKPVVNVPVKVKVDVDVEVTKNVHYVNFDYSHGYGNDYGYGTKPYGMPSY